MEDNSEKIQELERRIIALERRNIYLQPKIENDFVQHIQRLKERKKVLEKNSNLINCAGGNFSSRNKHADFLAGK
jgi:hypothetical protein